MVGEKRWLAEAVLWTVWKHRGTLRRDGTVEDGPEMHETAPNMAEKDEE